MKSFVITLPPDQSFCASGLTGSTVHLEHKVPKVVTRSAFHEFAIRNSCDLVLVIREIFKLIFICSDQD